jgi:hypothetical protein
LAWTGQPGCGSEAVAAEQRALNDIAGVEAGLREIRSRPDIMGFSDVYAQATRRTIGIFERSQPRVEIPLWRLCFHCLHLNSNRLGTMTADEVYLAALNRGLKSIDDMRTHSL